MGHIAINVSANGHPPDLEAVPAVTPAYFLPEGSRRSHALQHNSADTCRSQHFHMQAHARHTRWQQAQRVQNCAHWAAAHLMNAGASVSSPRDLSNEPRGAHRGSGSLAQLTCESRGEEVDFTQSRACNRDLLQKVSRVYDKTTLHLWHDLTSQHHSKTSGAKRFRLRSPNRARKIVKGGRWQSAPAKGIWENQRAWR